MQTVQLVFNIIWNLSTMDEETAAAFLLMQKTDSEACEADTINEEFNTHLTAALLITGANIGRLLRNERRNTTRNYLCRPQLQPNPRTGMAWQVLSNSQNDRAYIVKTWV